MTPASPGRPAPIVFPSELPSLRPAPDLGLVDELLRDRGAVLSRIERGEDLGRLARAMIVTIAVCAGAFGAAAGMHRGGVQVVLAAVKLPAALLLTAAICAPVLTTLNTVLIGRADVRRDLAVVLSSLGLASLVAAALAPLVLMAAESPTLGYHRMILVTVACAGLAGAVGLVFFLRSLRSYGDGEARLFVGVTVLTVFALVGAQTTWTLRPYVARPSRPIVVLHPIEGGFLDSVVRSAYSAAGIYVSSPVRKAAPGPVAPAPAPATAPEPEPVPVPVPASEREPEPEPGPSSPSTYAPSPEEAFP